MQFYNVIPIVAVVFLVIWIYVNWYVLPKQELRMQEYEEQKRKAKEELLEGMRKFKVPTKDVKTHMHTGSPSRSKTRSRSSYTDSTHNYHHTSSYDCGSSSSSSSSCSSSSSSSCD